LRTLLLFVAMIVCLDPIASASGFPPLVADNAPREVLRFQRGFAFYLDEDNFQFAHPTDQNYTLGTGFTWEGDEHDALDSHPLLDVPLDGFEAGARWAARRLLGLHLHASTRPAHYARTLFATAFTPETSRARSSSTATGRTRSWSDGRCGARPTRRSPIATGSRSGAARRRWARSGARSARRCSARSTPRCAW
jgi:hypothetical protein